MNDRRMISLSDPILGDAEKEAVADVIDSGWLTMGERVKAFETAFAHRHGATEAVAVNSCTAGLHLALAALEIGPGDEVLLPSLTFVATANAVLYVGAKPVFVDIESLANPHISMEAAKMLRTERTRAVIVMHYGGYSADMAGWRRFADEYRLHLIEDAAHAPGGEGVGRYADAAVFSFFSNKNMTTAEGGMVLARESDRLSRVRALRSHGMTTLTADRYGGSAHSYDVEQLGYNYRLDELRAALGLVQLAGLDAWNEKRRALNRAYRGELRQCCPELRVPFDETHETVAHIMPVILPEGCDRYRIMDRLRGRGILSSIHYPAVHRLSYYRRRFPFVALPVTEAYAERELTLPLHPALRMDELKRVVEALKGVVRDDKIQP